MIRASNTSLGKALVSTGLASSFLLSCPSPAEHRKLLYLKPVQTGFPADSESQFVFSRLCSLGRSSNRKSESITQQFDACASWWTQGPDTALQIELARELGYAAGRFGWASRSYFSDNGSTAIEIALKMAFRKFYNENDVLSGRSNTVERCFELKVLALNGSYHGDTLGAMEAQAPSSYTAFTQQPW
ncbi:unnamed protein product [Linum tenue]|uniref:Uncharacterized protein n=1 Tax=Linum tenue TaxID=586396 RepID=A0AAV0L0V9_9ROSI|nr:unnamed protein product [Linum tenue]